MKTLALTLIASIIIHVYSHIDSTQQVTLSCPARPEGITGPAGVPGKRGSKGESGSRGKIRCNISERRFDAVLRLFWLRVANLLFFPDDFNYSNST